MKSNVASIGLVEFQQQAALQRLRDPRTLDFTTLRLTEEAGEVAGVVKQFARKNKTTMGKRDTARLKDEMGDVLHALAILADVAGLELSEIAAQSLKKQTPKLKKKKGR
jgi:NTP pyrophosphatase (non-canonical NTP hydrolase)